MKPAPLPVKPLSCGEPAYLYWDLADHKKRRKVKTRLKNWRVLQSLYVKRSPWVNWRVDTCRLPNGERVEEYHVSEIPTGVGVVALTPGHEVILVRQYRHGARTVLFEIPGGMVNEQDQTPLQAARRELREEAGYTSRSWTLLGEMFLHPPSQDNLVFLYLARDARRTSSVNLDREEDIEVIPTPLRKVIEMIRKKRFKSLGSAAAILLAREKMGF